MADEQGLLEPHGECSPEMLLPLGGRRATSTPPLGGFRIRIALWLTNPQFSRP